MTENKGEKIILLISIEIDSKSIRLIIVPLTPYIIFTNKLKYIIHTYRRRLRGHLSNGCDRRTHNILTHPSCVLQVKDTCCGDRLDEAQCQIACEKFLANTPSINRHAVNQEILDLCMVDKRDARSTTSVPHHRCTRNTTAARPSDGHKCKSKASWWTS